MSMTNKFVSDFSSDDQTEILQDARYQMHRNPEEYRSTLYMVCDKWGIGKQGILIWKRRHCIDYMQKYRRDLSTYRLLVSTAYLPWVETARLSDDLKYNSSVSLYRMAEKYKIPLRADPWSDRVPRIPYRDIIQIFELVQKYESLVLVAEKSGYSLQAIHDVFGFQREIVVRKRCDAFIYREGKHSLRGYR